MGGAVGGAGRAWVGAAAVSSGVVLEAGAPGRGCGVAVLATSIEAADDGGVGATASVLVAAASMALARDLFEGYKLVMRGWRGRMGCLLWLVCCVLRS